MNLDYQIDICQWKNFEYLIIYVICKIGLTLFIGEDTLGQFYSGATVCYADLERCVL